MESTIDLTHLNALELRLSHERVRLQDARTKREREMRQVWVAGIEREIAGERLFLGLEEESPLEISDEELLSQLLG